MDSLDGLIAKVLHQRINKPKPPTIEDLPELEADWEKWLRAVFPGRASKPFSFHHREFWRWVWSLQAGEPARPFVLCLPRGHGKSTSAEMAAAFVLATGRRTFALVVAGTQDSANDHVKNIASLLESPGIQALYPSLGTPRVGLHGNRAGWRQAELRTESGSMVRAVGLDASSRGIKDDEVRPDFYILEEIDKITDGPEAVAKKILILTSDILPTRGDPPAVIFPQNLIHRNSVMAHVMDGRTGLLSTAIKVGPIKAFTNLAWARDPDNAARGILLAGEPTWQGFGLREAQADVDIFGIESFLTECQQELSAAVQGAVYPAYSEIHHVITQSEFLRYFGADAWDEQRQAIKLPNHGEMAMGIDFGTTAAHPTVAGWYWRPGEARWNDKDGLSDCLFHVGEIWRPTSRAEEVEGINALQTGRLINEIEQANDWRRRIRFRVGSHEASDERNLLARELTPSVSISSRQTRSSDGIPVVQAYLEIDQTKPHPFRCDPDSGDAIAGRPRLFILVPDEDGKLFRDSQGDLRVKAATHAAGAPRLRAEFPVYHYETTLAGFEKEKPVKNFDDALDQLSYVASLYGPPLKRLIPEDRALKRLEKLAPHLTSEVVNEILDQHKHSGALAAQEILLKKLLQDELKPKNLNLGSFLRRNRRK